MASNLAEERDVVADLREYLNNEKTYSARWNSGIGPNEDLKIALSRASKKGTGHPGSPDLVYINPKLQLLIIGEVKRDIRHFQSVDGSNPEKYAVDGIVHYLKYFTEAELEISKENLSKSFLNWKIYGIAFAGSLLAKNYIVSTFRVKSNDDRVESVDCTELLDEEGMMSLDRSIATSKLIDDIDQSSRKINNWLRNLDSQKRPILLSALMICLIPDKDSSADFRNTYRQITLGENLIKSILHTHRSVLKEEGVVEEKIMVLANELAFMNTDIDLQSERTLWLLLNELENKVIPLMKEQSSYDVLGKFYHDFLRYAGVTNVKNGIVLTPRHICELFVKLVDIKTNDVIFDPACGTGSFLIAAMDELQQLIKGSNSQDTSQMLKDLKEKRLVGMESNSTMYALSVSNMLFRGDGKSQIYNVNFFSPEADKILDRVQPSIGFINPPYGGKDKASNPTKKEVQFLERMLDKCSRYGVIISPWSTFIGDKVVRKRILTKHNLVYSINMPKTLFEPNASASTAICVFETGRPHNSGKDTIFYDLTDDGFVLTKTKGRIDLFNKWSTVVFPRLRREIEPGYSSSQHSKAVAVRVDMEDEWLIQAHTPVDYSMLTQTAFERVVKEYAVFLARRKSDRLLDNLTDSDWVDLVSGYLVSEAVMTGEIPPLDVGTWKQFYLCNPSHTRSLFDIAGAKVKLRKEDVERLGPGDCLWITTSNQNNGVSDVCFNSDYEWNVLTIDSATDGKTFYQPFQFVGSDHVEVLKPRKDTVLNIFTGLFLVTVCDLHRQRYSYGRKRAQKRIKEEQVMLPVKADGSINWEWMELYIKHLPYSSSIVD